MCILCAHSSLCTPRRLYTNLTSKFLIQINSVSVIVRDIISVFYTSKTSGICFGCLDLKPDPTWLGLRTILFISPKLYLCNTIFPIYSLDRGQFMGILLSYHGSTGSGICVQDWNPSSKFLFSRFLTAVLPEYMCLLRAHELNRFARLEWI